MEMDLLRFTSESVASPVTHGCSRIWPESSCVIVAQERNLISGDAPLGINAQHLVDEVHGLVGDLAPIALVKLKHALHDLLVEQRIVFVVERRVSTQPVDLIGKQDKHKHDEHAHAQRPDINLVIVPSLKEDLRGNILGDMSM